MREKMSSECDKCGEHALEYNCETVYRRQETVPGPNDKFFFKGKFFETEEEFWKYVNEWPFLTTDEETFLRGWSQLGKEIWLNMSMRKQEFTNGALNEILQEHFMYLLHRFFRVKDEQ
jgi:hypothetical protein